VCVCVAVKRVIDKHVHELCSTRLTVRVVELDDIDVDVDEDVCRTLSAATAPPGNTASLSCVLHNYLASVDVKDTQFQLDDANNRIVVVVSSDQGMR